MNVLEVFTGNPFNTPVGQRIDKATDGSLPSEDWALNMEICDIISETDDGPKEAIKALRKKIVNNIGKDWRAVNYCLIVLETCVKNCGKRFHLQVANKEFLNDLLKILSPKNEPSVALQEKVLGLIQAWTDAFRGSPDLKAVELCYQELKQKGVEFPATDMDSVAPIHTPKSSVEPQLIVTGRGPMHTSQPHQMQQLSHRAPQPTALQPRQQSAAAPGADPAAMSRQPTTEQMSKLRADVDIVQGNCRVFNEMLNTATTNPSELTSETTDLMKELNRTCRQMQQRIVILIEQLADEQVTEVLLRVNDDLNNAFLRYDRLERVINMSASNAASAKSSSPSSAPAVPAGAAGAAGGAVSKHPPPPAEDSLIDFGNSGTTMPPPVTGNALAAHMDKMNVTPASNISNVKDVPKASKGVDEFDMFAQSRKYDARKQDVAASYAFQSESAGSNNSMGAAAAGPNPYKSDEDVRQSATSFEFDKFLEERAAAGERLPDKNTPEGITESQQPPQGTPTRTNNRQLHKDDSENALFAL